MSDQQQQGITPEEKAKRLEMAARYVILKALTAGLTPDDVEQTFGTTGAEAGKPEDAILDQRFDKNGFTASELRAKVSEMVIEFSEPSEGNV